MISAYVNTLDPDLQRSLTLVEEPTLFHAFLEEESQKGYKIIFKRRDSNFCPLGRFFQGKGIDTFHLTALPRLGKQRDDWVYRFMQSVDANVYTPYISAGQALDLLNNLLSKKSEEKEDHVSS